MIINKSFIPILLLSLLCFSKRIARLNDSCLLFIRMIEYNSIPIEYYEVISTYRHAQLDIHVTYYNDRLE
jgi:hypothetical protein